MHGMHTSETYNLGGMILSPLKVATTHWPQLKWWIKMIRKQTKIH